MTAPHVVLHAGRGYRVVDDVTTIYRALAMGRAVDGMLSRQPVAPADQRPTTAVSVRVAQAGLRAVVLPDASFGLAGDPRRLEPGGPLTLDLHVSAPGYEPVARQTQIPGGAALPYQLQPALVLERRPVRLQGRVTANRGDYPGIQGARVRVVGPPQPELPPQPPSQPHALGVPLALAHAAGAAVEPVPLTATAANRNLVAPVPAGATQAVLDNRLGLAIGSVLRFGQEPGADYAEVANPAPPGAPGVVVLRTPLHRAFPDATPVRNMTVGPAGPATTLARQARPGTAVVVLNAQVAADHVRIEPGTARVEYAAVGTWTRAGGFWRLDGIGDVAEVALRFSAAQFNAAVVSFSVNHVQPVGVIDIRLAPLP
jgi:hypothetical protein